MSASKKIGALQIPDSIYQIQGVNGCLPADTFSRWPLSSQCVLHRSQSPFPPPLSLLLCHSSTSSLPLSLHFLPHRNPHQSTRAAIRLKKNKMSMRHSSLLLQPRFLTGLWLQCLHPLTSPFFLDRLSLSLSHSAASHSIGRPTLRAFQRCRVRQAAPTSELG